MNRYIDADKAKEQIVNSFVTDIFCLTDDEVGRADKAILDEIDKVPTADVVEVKRGKWKVDETHDYEPYCSLCGHEPIAGEKYNYCPDCGADMRGDKR